MVLDMYLEVTKNKKSLKLSLKLLSVFKGFVDMIGKTFQINANCLPVEGTIGTFQQVSGLQQCLKIEKYKSVKIKYISYLSTL